MAAAALFSSAQSLFSSSKLASGYQINGVGAGTSGTGGGYTTQAALWTVQKATHKVNGKQVSIWTCDKTVLAGSSKVRGKLETAIEVLKKEVSMLSRLRHPCVLEVVEPLEETRTSLTFATEPVSGTLRSAIGSSESKRYRRGSTQEADQMGELDEIEIQKGLLQIGKALQFLHESAKLVHCNLTPDAIVINAKGDWKLSGFGLSTYLTSQNGQPPKWDFPSFDKALPQAVQRDFDYMAPEYALDETLVPSNDMYALGAIIFAIHTKSGPPFSNRGNLQRLRDNVENLGSIRASWHKLGDEVQDVLSQLLTRYPSTRMTAVAFQSSRYFSSILVSTLRFLDRDNFSAKPREEQASFLKGLLKVLPQFSDKVIKRKILPSLLEETRKNMLVPFLLPCIFYIGQKMDKEEFKELVLPDLKPLFAVREPPQTMLALLDSLKLFHEKCDAHTFREDVLPLVYNAMDSEIAPVLEKALKVIPELSESLDYATVKNMLLPKITVVFSKTTSLAVKVTTLICFKSLVPVLDKFTLTEKLVPLLSRIKTKEPGVMIATLAVHEQIGLKCDIQAIATLVLPQLWAMSITPLLSADQFRRFMTVIKQLSNRVEEEHSKHLAEIKRLEETSGTGHVRRGTLEANGQPGEVDFEALVRGGSGQGSQRSFTPDPFGTTDDFAKFDNFSLGPSSHTSPSLPSTSTLSPPMSTSTSAQRSPMKLGNGSAPTTSAKAASLLGARTISAATYQARSNSFAITPDSSAPNTPPAIPSRQTSSTPAALPPPMSFSQPSQSNRVPMSGYNQPSSSGPNYNITLQPATSMPNSFAAPLQPSSSSLFPSQPAIQAPSYMQPLATQQLQPQALSPAIQWGNAPIQPAWSPQPSSQPPWQQQPASSNFGAVLQPTKKETSFDWSDLDPMR